MSSINKSLLGTLPGVSKSGYEYAYLIKEDDLNKSTSEPLFKFLFNPESIDWSIGSEWVENPTAYTSVPTKQWYRGKGAVWNLNELLLEAYYASKSIAPLLTQLADLRNPITSKDGYTSPPVLYFVWGTRKLGPAVLTNLQVKEDGWASGIPTSAKVSITLEEIPPTDLRPNGRGKAPSESTKGSPVAASSSSKTPTLKSDLTERELADAETKVRAALAANPPKSQIALIKTKNFKLELNKQTGVVKISDAKGTSLGIVGIYDGTAFYSVSQLEKEANKLKEQIRAVWKNIIDTKQPLVK